MSGYPAPLSGLCPPACPPACPAPKPVCAPACPPPPCDPCAQNAQMYQYGVSGWCKFLVWFFIITIIAFIILWLVNPAQLQNRDALGNPTGQQNAWKILVASIVIALIFILILWLLRTAKC